jgi:hypothetical protein
VVVLIAELHWRDDRVDHIARHSVRPEEVEDALFEDVAGLLLRVGPAERDPQETLYRYFGRTAAGRYLMIALLHLGEGVAIPLTARDMTAAERRRFDARSPRPR